jgi:hypothetical protein
MGTFLPIFLDIIIHISPHYHQILLIFQAAFSSSLHFKFTPLAK